MLHYVLHYLDKDLKEKKWECEIQNQWFSQVGRGSTLPLTPEDESDQMVTDAVESGGVVDRCRFFATMPVPSPGKYVIRKKYLIANSATTTFTPPPKPFHQRSATLGSASRSSTLVANKVHQSRTPMPLGMVKPKTLDIKAPKTRRLLKSQSKKATTSTSYSMYDDNFIRYVNELDSYFKASELRHQSSKEVDKKAYSNHMTFPGTELGAMSTLSNGLFQSVHTSYRPGIPQISLSSVQNESGGSNEDDNGSLASDNGSYCTTMDHDWSSFMTSTPDYDSLSFFVTPSQGTTPELSCYVTAEQNTTSEDTCVYKLPEEYGSQETLFNADSDYEESSFRSILNYENGQRADQQVGIEEGFSQMSLGFRVRDNVLSNSCSPRGSIRRGSSPCGFSHRGSSPRSSTPRTDDEATVMVEKAEDSNKKLEAKVRRSNFVRTSCIDLDDEYKSDADSATVVTLQVDEKKKESYFKCCPV